VLHEIYKLHITKFWSYRGARQENALSSVVFNMVWRVADDKKLRSSFGKTEIRGEIGCQIMYLKWKHLRKKKSLPSVVQGGNFVSRCGLLESNILAFIQSEYPVSINIWTGNFVQNRCVAAELNLLTSVHCYQL
jgi:hypothetical protein